MANDNYTGPSGGDWFDPANWTNGVPVSGDIADIFGANGADATSGTILGLTIDVSGSFTELGFGELGFLVAPSFDLGAGQLGSVAAPVMIEATADSGMTSQAGIAFETLDGSIQVASGQTLTVGVGDTTTVNGTIDVGRGATLNFVGYSPSSFARTSPVILNGPVRVDGGTLVLSSGSVSGTGSIEIANGGTTILETDPAVQTSPGRVAIQFDPSGGTLNTNDYLGGYGGTISGFGAGDTIIAATVGVGPVDVGYAGGLLTLSNAQGLRSDSFTFAGNYTAANFDVSAISDTAYAIAYQPCFAAGTFIATESGDRAVEDLRVGDVVRLHDGGSAPVVWSGHRRQIGGEVIRIRAGALGLAIPRRDLIVSTDHGMFLDGVLVQAGLLADGDGIVRETREMVVFHHVELARHGILLAEGAPAESYLDTGNRRQFANCAVGYDPVEAASHEPCAEVVHAGARLDAIRRRLCEPVIA